MVSAVVSILAAPVCFFLFLYLVLVFVVSDDPSTSCSKCDIRKTANRLTAAVSASFSSNSCSSHSGHGSFAMMLRNKLAAHTASMVRIPLFLIDPPRHVTNPRRMPPCNAMASLYSDRPLQQSAKKHKAKALIPSSPFCSAINCATGSKRGTKALWLLEKGERG